MKTATDTERLGAWELASFDFCSRYTSNSSNILEILAIGAEIIDTEMSNEGQRMSPHFGTGFSIMFCFVYATVCGSALYFDRLRWNTIIVAVCCAIVPILVITTTLGVTSLLGNRTNSFVLLMPFLVMGIEISIFCFASAMALSIAYIIYNVIIYPILYFCSLKGRRSPRRVL